MIITAKMFSITDLASFSIVFLAILRESYSVPVRLVGGKGPYEGRLEVLDDGDWGTVADNYEFGQLEAQTICRQLGYTGYALATNSGVFGKGSGKIAFGQIKCSTDNDFQPLELEQCELKKETKKSRHDYDVGVVCNSSYPKTRLVGGAGPHEGRLEVQFRNQWGLVCIDSSNTEMYGKQNAKVLCRNFGYGAGTVMKSSTKKFGSGRGPVWLKSVKCETHTDPASIKDCVRQWGNMGDNSCSNRKKELAVVCNASIPREEMRLVGGQSPSEGRLEIRYNGQWGTVCREGGFWKSGGDESAKTVCQQLGYNNSGQSYEAATSLYGEGTGWVWKQINFCAGDVQEPCVDMAIGMVMPTRGFSDCDHNQDVGVICDVKSPPEIRLKGSSNPYEGIPEIKFADEWGSICHAYWNYKESSAICRQLGYTGYNADKTDKDDLKKFGQSTLSRIWLDQINCPDDAARVDLCNREPIGVASCQHRAEDLGGVICDHSSPPVPIRLNGGETSNEGRVEIKYQDEWGSICVEEGQSWGQAEADVVCRQLGLKSGSPEGKSYATSGNVFGQVSHQTKIWLDRIKCEGDERVLKNCERGVWGGRGACDHSQDVGVICEPAEGKYQPLSPLIRLAGGSGYNEGRLEVFFNDEWGTVCHQKRWDFGQLPKTVCKQLGLTNGPSKLTRKFGAGEGRIWLEGVRCEGDEVSVDACQHAAWGVVTCDHSMDIGIQCDVFQRSRAGMVVGIIFAILIIILIIVIGVFLYRRMYFKTDRYTDVPLEDKM